MKRAGISNLRWFVYDVQSVLVRNLSIEGTNKSSRDLPSSLLDIYARVGDEQIQETLLYRSRRAENTCNPTWSNLNIDLTSSPELVDCTSIICRIYDPSRPEGDKVEIPLELTKLAFLGCQPHELGSLPLNTILFQMRDGLYSMDRLYVLLRSRGEIQMPSSTETQLAADTQNNYQLVQELQQELVALEEELQGLRGQIDTGVTQKVAPYASYERSTLVAEVVMLQKIAAERERALALEEEALKEEQEMLENLKQDLKSSIEKRATLESSTTQAQEALKTETNELVKTQFLLEARQVKLVSDLQAIYPIALLESNEWAIRDLELPGDLNLRDDEHVSSALGYVAHLVLLLSKYLEVPLRYRLIYNASRSMIKDPVLSNAALPLYKRGAERERFDRAVYWLQRDVEQLIQSRGIAYDHSQPLLYNLQQLFTREMAPRINT